MALQNYYKYIWKLLFFYYFTIQHWLHWKGTYTKINKMKNKIKTVYNLALHITSKTEYSTILSNGAWIVKSWHYTPQIEPELNVNLRFIKKGVKISSTQSGCIYLSVCLLWFKTVTRTWRWNVKFTLKNIPKS